MPIINKIDSQRRYSVKKAKEASAEISMPIRVKVMDIPVTMVMGRSLLPTEPDNIAGRIGRTHGVIIVAMPAMKTQNTDGAVGINI
jgi:hypothetical protein